MKLIVSKTVQYFTVIGLKKECIKRGITMRALAKKLKVHESYLSYINTGDRNVSKEMYKRILEAFK